MELARPARDEDRAACDRLLVEVLAGARTMRGGPALAGQATSEELLTRWSHAGAQLFVGEFDGVVVGLLGVTTSTRAEDGPARGLIECCYVEEGARGVGVGGALMQAGVGWCRDQGCLEIDAVALPGDRATKQRLEAEGFTARLLTLSRRLE